MHFSPVVQSCVDFPICVDLGFYTDLGHEVELVSCVLVGCIHSQAEHGCVPPVLGPRS